MSQIGIGFTSLHSDSSTYSLNIYTQWTPSRPDPVLTRSLYRPESIYKENSLLLSFLSTDVRQYYIDLVSSTSHRYLDWWCVSFRPMLPIIVTSFLKHDLFRRILSRMEMLRGPMQVPDDTSELPFSFKVLAFDPSRLAVRLMLDAIRLHSI